MLILHRQAKDFVSLEGVIKIDFGAMHGKTRNKIRRSNEAFSVGYISIKQTHG
jgi:hypothetical protein